MKYLQWSARYGWCQNYLVHKVPILTGHFTLTRTSDVLWQKTRNAAIFCVHRIPLSCVQKPLWLLPWVPACQSSYLISVYSSWPCHPWWSLSWSHAGVITESWTIKFNISKKMWAPLWPWSSWDNATQDKKGEYSDADIWTVDTSHDIHVSLQRDQLGEASVVIRCNVFVCWCSFCGYSLALLGQTLAARSRFCTRKC